MNADYLRNIRFKLQKRVRWLNGTQDVDQFWYRLKRFWAFFDADPILTGVAQELSAEFPDCTKEADQIFQGQMVIGSTEEESAAIGHQVLRRFAESTERLKALYRLAPTHAQRLDHLRSLYLEPFYEYVDERVDDRSFILFALVRYKHLCEWFRRENLYNSWKQETAKGESQLAKNLYEYLYEQGVDLHIEPLSASGRPDMVSVQVGDERLIADAKVFGPETRKGYVGQAFRQVYQYTCDYDQAIGYLVIFNTSEKQLNFLLPATAEPLPRLTHNYKTIFFEVIDIFPHSDPASRRKVSDVVEITEQDIVGTLTPQPENQSSAQLSQHEDQ